MYRTRYKRIAYSMLIVLLVCVGFFLWLGYALYPDLMVVQQALFNPYPDCSCSQYSIILTHPTQFFVPVLLFLIGSITIFFAFIRAVISMIRTHRFAKGLFQKRIHTTYCKGIAIHTVESIQPLAVSIGIITPQIFVSTALRKLLTPQELWAVVQHELAHALNHDPRQRFVMRFLARCLPFHTPLLEELSTLQELAADDAVTDRSALQLALLKMIDQPPAAPASMAVAFFASTNARIDRLLGRVPTLRPALAWFVSASAIVVIAIYSVQLVKADTDYKQLHSCLNQEVMCVAEQLNAMSQQPTMTINE